MRIFCTKIIETNFSSQFKEDDYHKKGIFMIKRNEKLTIQRICKVC